MDKRYFGTWVDSRSSAVLSFFNLLLSRLLKQNIKSEGRNVVPFFFFLISIALDFGIASNPTEIQCKELNFRSLHLTVA